MSGRPFDVKPAEGKLGIMLVGLGAVSTTFVAGVEMIRKGLAAPIGTQAWMGTVRLGRRTEKKVVKINKLVSLASPDDLVFAAWDVFPENAYDAARAAGVLAPGDLAMVEDDLRSLRPLSGAFDRNFVRRLDGDHVKRGTRRELAEALRKDILEFTKSVSRAVMIWAGSTEIHSEPGPAHASLESFERALDRDDRSVAPSQLYAYAALREGVPFANGAPNLTVDTPALLELASKNAVPIAGKDFKTGQTLMKTIIGPGLKNRLLGISGWFSTNILGNRDGEVLDDPESFKSKEISKAGVLDTMLQREIYPELYGDLCHKIDINYYPPRGDAKEGWDNIDIFGWLGYPMQIKINFLCRDSILAAPLVLDLALFLDLARRAGLKGIQEWLSLYFKSPQVGEGLYPEHDLNIQKTKFKNTLRRIAGEELITHLGLDYYEDGGP